jgi:hypothetical protein
MNAIELDAIAHDGKVIVTIPKPIKSSGMTGRYGLIFWLRMNRLQNPKNPYCHR